MYKNNHYKNHYKTDKNYSKSANTTKSLFLNFHLKIRMDPDNLKLLSIRYKKVLCPAGRS